MTNSVLEEAAFRIHRATWATKKDEADARKEWVGKGGLAGHPSAAHVARVVLAYAAELAIGHQYEFSGHPMGEFQFRQAGHNDACKGIAAKLTGEQP